MVPACTCYMWCRRPVCISIPYHWRPRGVRARARIVLRPSVRSAGTRDRSPTRAKRAKRAVRAAGPWALARRGPLSTALRVPGGSRRACGRGPSQVPFPFSRFAGRSACRRRRAPSSFSRIRALAVGPGTHKRMFLFLFQRMISAGFYSAWRFLARTLYTPLTTVRCDIQHKSLPRVPCTRPLEGRCRVDP